MRKLIHPLGDGIGGKSAGIQTLIQFGKNRIYEEMFERAARRIGTRPNGQMRISVPETTVLASGHFESYAKKNGLREPLCPEGLRAAVARAGIRDEKTFEALAEAAESLEGPVAVRSSASCEDSGRRSPFAGNFSTAFAVLGQGMGTREKVGRLISAVNEVYSSFFGENVQKKMASLGMNPSDHYMAVVLQPVMGKADVVETAGGLRKLHMPFASAVLASSSIGLQRPPGVGRNSPFMRLGFGLGTLVVGSESGEQVPCRVLFPERMGVSGIPLSISIIEGRGHLMFDILLGEFLALQDKFDAIDCGNGKVERISLEDVQDRFFFKRNSPAISSLELGDAGYNVRPGRLIQGGERNTIRATFQEFIEGPEGRIFYEFAGDLARMLRDACGFDVDLEMALARKNNALELGLLQLRPFGSRGERIMLRDVGQERLVAKTDDCIGNGRQEMDKVVIVTREAMGPAAGTAQCSIGMIDRKYRGRYMIIGPNIIRDIGIGGAYGEVNNPGLILSYDEDGASMMAAGTHMYNNIAMMRVIETGKGLLAGTIKRLLGEAERVCEGVYILEKKSVAELDGVSGHAQAYWVE